MDEFLKYPAILFLLLMVACNQGPSEKASVDTVSDDTLVVLHNDTVKLSVSLQGGAFVEFQHKNNPVNPFNGVTVPGDYSKDKKDFFIRGQFICLGRWGKPTNGESKLGMPFNGEPANNLWKLERLKKKRILEMSCEAPLDGQFIYRTVELSESSPLFKVTETVTNELSVWHVNTMVQSLTLAPPFQSEKFVLNTNATYGFNQALAFHSLFKYEYTWPEAYSDTLQLATIDLSHNTSVIRYTSSHIFSDTVGWITAASPENKLMLGYIWKTKDYPWLWVKNDVDGRDMWVKSFGFSTTGMGADFKPEETLSAIFRGVTNAEVVDAKDKVTKSYYCFLIKIPANYEKTLKVMFNKQGLSISILTSWGVRRYKLEI
ncbi:MAG: hypothetical protein Q8928_09195 [Bacteroidota bacterium]|nr:hypothetical protein [Bacteroidota bacterium]